MAHSSHSWRIGVFATVHDGQGRVLLCHLRDADYWNQPGAPWRQVRRPGRRCYRD
ncbi:MAG: hypothetical protein ABI068_12480 [Ktedonobacterales bacterium]